jgi:hypothetical protein
MRGFRHAWILAIVLLIILILTVTGCSKTCAPESTREERPITRTVEIYAEEPYTVQENKVVEEKCIERHYSDMNDSKFSLSIGEKEWIGKPLIVGQTNYLRRIVTVFNGRDEVDAVYLDKIYLYDGEETKRSEHPMMFLVEPKSTRKLFVMWDTQYDPLKDVTIDFTNNTEELGFTTDIMRLCYNQTEQVNVTKYRKVVTGTEEEITGYDSVVKVKLKRDC